MLALGSSSEETRLDAQIRVGGDAGASEVLILNAGGELAEQSEAMISALLLPDAPIVAWWADEVPEDVSATPIGRIAHRRITDSAMAAAPVATLERLAHSYDDGDTDLAWTRLTRWRIPLASILDSMHPRTVTAVPVETPPELPSAVLLAAWLQKSLDVPVRLHRSATDNGLSSVRLHLSDDSRGGDEIVLSRPVGDIASLHLPDGPVQQVPMPHRTLEDCLAEELRRLDADEVFGEVLARGLAAVDLTVCRTAA